MYTACLGLLAFLLAPAVAAETPTLPTTVRFATFNVSMFRDRPGALLEELADPKMQQARHTASILQEVRPDVVLLNEFDWDVEGAAVRRFRDGFLAVGQDGRPPLDYPFTYVPETNTGVHSGHDLDADGTVTSVPGSREYGGDAFGYGEFSGQYGLAILSRFPIDSAQVRTFRLLRWKDVPGHLIPEGWYSPEALTVMRLSSKNHVDVPIRIGGRVVHLLASHPTPPTFDGPEDRNGRRNADEVRFWSHYVGIPQAAWIADDQGRRGGLGEASFIIAGDLNSDPVDGDSHHDAIQALLLHPRVRARPVPSAPGGVEQARLQAGRNLAQAGDPAHDTVDFDDHRVGNLRLDYVLPSIDLPIMGSGVFWPRVSDPRFALVGTYPFPVSDHRLVWVDVRLPAPVKEAAK